MGSRIASDFSVPSSSRSFIAERGENHNPRESRTMLSRVADSLYWMSRYLERAENTVRLLDVTMSLMLDTGGVNLEPQWQRMVAALGKSEEMEWDGTLESMARRLVFDGTHPAA